MGKGHGRTYHHDYWGPMASTPRCQTSPPQGHRASRALTGRADELKGYGGTLLLVDEGKVRALADREVARILWVCGLDYEALLKEHTLEDVHLSLASEPGWQVSVGLLGWVQEALQARGLEEITTRPEVLFTAHSSKSPVRAQ